MEEKISLTPRIMELQNENDIYMSMNVRILSAEPNLNMAEFTEDFIVNTVEQKEKFIGIPFVVDRESLENGSFDNLTHQYTSEGDLQTDQIGSFVDFWYDKDDNDTLFLAGQVRIMKRFPKTCEAIQELFTQGELNTSCEVLVKSYEEISEDGIRKIHYNDGNNRLFASCIVTSPADVNAKPSLLIAEAYKKDVSLQEELEQKGGEPMTKETQYNKGIKVKYHKTEVASLHFYEIEKQIYNSLNPVDVENGGRDYNYWIYELKHDNVIVQCEDKYDLYSVNFKIENDTVVLDKQEDWKKGSFQFVPEGVSVAELMENKDKELMELEEELSKLKEEKLLMNKDLDQQIEDLQAQITKLEEEITALEAEKEELSSTVVSQQEEVVKAQDSIKELNDTIEDLSKYKEQVEAAEKQARMEELSDKFSKLLDEDVLASEEVKQAIENLDEAALNGIVVAEIAKKKVETAEAKQKDVLVAAQTVETSKDKNYWLSNK